MKCQRARVIFTLVSLFSYSLLSQEFRGTITGIITDPSGAPVAGANVTATEKSTQTKVQTVTDSAGQYTAPFLLPGAYDIEARFEGFKEYTRKGVNLGAGDRVAIDIRLEVGSSSQSVEVTADAPLINAENASVGQAITTKEVENLPLNGGTPLVLASLSIGVLATGQPSLIHPFDSGGAAGWSIGGTASQTNEILINGSPDATWDGRLAYSPPRDAVQEVRVKAFDSDAAFGHTGGGTLNQVLKSGTNQFHGTLSEANQPNTLAANNYFNNKAGLGNPVTHYNQYGATVGGPVVLPKILNGRDKLFFFFAWESLKDAQPNTTFLSVPTAAERTGDFSALLKVNNTYQLYNPYAATLSGTTITRQPYPNNIIPSSQLNPVALAMLKYYPLPNISTGRSDGFNNYGNTTNTTDDYNNELGRIDYNMSQRNRIFMDIRRTGYLQSKNNYFGNLATGSLLTRDNWGSSFDDVFTVNATNVVDLRLNFTRMAETHPSPSAGFDPTSLGLPSYLTSNSQYPQLPYVTFASNSGFQALGTNGANKLPSQSAQLFATWITLHGPHSVRFGLDVRQYNLNVSSYGNSVGNFAFTANSWVRSGSGASSTVVLGQDFAEFLLGLPTGGQYDVNASGAFYQHYLAGFVQDDWRVNKNLTINAGVRFDHDGPFNEKYGRTVNGFDTTSQSPLAAAAQVAYALHPISQLSPANFSVLGGLLYPGKGSTSIFNTTSHLVSPRFGAAWTPERLHGKTVLRAGFGIFVSPITIANLSPSGAYSTNPLLTQEGFSQTTQLVPTGNNYLTPSATISNPFPTGIASPVGSAQGLGTFAGQTVAFLNPDMKNPYSMRWNFGIQQQLTKDTALEVVYMGNHGVHLPVTATQLNGIPRQFLSTQGTRDQNVITALTATATNPFAGLATSQNTASTTVAQLLARYPQFPVGSGSFSTGVIEDNANAGSSYYESLNVRISKRFSNGLSLVGNYIHSRLMERIAYVNDTDSQLEKRVSPFDHPNRFVTAVSYELPFGKGRRFDLHSRWADLAVGGWLVNSIYTYQTGAPITWLNGSTSSPGDYIYFGGAVALNNRETNTAAFNTSVFDTKSTEQLQYHIRTFSTTFGNLRQDGINQLDVSALKRFAITERMRFELRAEAYNMVNHPTFAAPNTTATNSQFGLITAQSNRPRTMMFGARFVF
jgi:hypothetical protein